MTEPPWLLMITLLGLGSVGPPVYEPLLMVICGDVGMPDPMSTLIDGVPPEPGSTKAPCPQVILYA